MGGYTDVDTVAQCYRRAKKLNREYFGVENGDECYANDPNAAKTYMKYGEGDGCSGGKGSGWRINVYKVKSKLFYANFHKFFFVDSSLKKGDINVFMYLSIGDV